MAAIAQLQQGLAVRNLVGVEAIAAGEFIKRQQAGASPTTTPAITATENNAAAVSTLLSAYLSANPSLHSANADIIFALAQDAYNSALERGETPPPPVLAIPGNTATTTLTAVPTNTASATGRTSNTTSSAVTSRNTTAAATTSAGSTGTAGQKYGAGRMMVLGLCGVMAALVVLA
ncbi:hypothetical protein P389DRAFT_33815 [Cystobasidium minutum MCA 4210]|uniref:uncharacterized protein n=1 Tax=Cystobasidium minutum MCA 4210 TaxID=1397322 RepID=UPI0034CE4079|eukprot:jgi/Rhomi1/33815/CE33814_72